MVLRMRAPHRQLQEARRLDHKTGMNLVRPANASLTDLDVARAWLFDGLHAVAPVEVALEDALGAVCARSCRALEDWPATDVASIDGFALASSSLSGASAYSPAMLAAAPAWIENGQSMPEGCDCVLEAHCVDIDGPLVAGALRRRAGTRRPPQRRGHRSRQAFPEAGPSRDGARPARRETDRAAECCGSPARLVHHQHRRERRTRPYCRARRRSRGAGRRSSRRTGHGRARRRRHRRGSDRPASPISSSRLAARATGTATPPQVPSLPAVRCLHTGLPSSPASARRSAGLAARR